MTEKGWTTGALKSHLGASFQTLHRLRAAMLAAVAPGGDPARLPGVLSDIAAHLTAEGAWLDGLDPVPETLRRSDRARFLALWGHQVVATAQALTLATETPVAAERMEAFGVSLLQLLAREQGARELRR